MYGATIWVGKENNAAKKGELKDADSTKREIHKFSSRCDWFLPTKYIFLNAHCNVMK